MSSKIIAFPRPPAGPTKGSGQPHGTGAGARVGVARAWAAVLSPALAALASLALHLVLPDRQLVPFSWVDGYPSWLHPYPALLGAVLAASLLLAFIQAAWRPLRPWVRHHAPLLAGAVLLLCAWDLITLKLDWMQLPFFPGPDAVLGAIVEDRKILFESTWRSLLLLLTGYAAGVSAGLITGVLIGWFGVVRYWVMPALKILGPLPATALVALVMSLSSYSFVSAAAMIGFAVWFPVTMLTSSGVSNVRISYLDVARTLGAGRKYLIFRVAVPAALPSVFLGLFMGLVVSFLTLTVAESIGVQAGLGWYLKWQQGYVEYAKVYAALLIMAAFCSGIMTLLFKARDRVLRWQKGVIKW